MKPHKPLKISVAGLAGALVIVTGSLATQFNIPGGDLKTALDNYAKQAGVPVIVSSDAVDGTRTKGARGELSPEEALSRVLAGTGFVTHHEGAAVVIVRDDRAEDSRAVHIAAASVPTIQSTSLETVTVTSSKIGGDVQNIPISITALSQEQLTARQIAGGPDLVKEVPNLTFSKTNFSGYNIQIRGIGTQAISVTTDPAVAVALNDIPFIRNHFFEQEFYDLSQAEVLRGPQGTLYGRNATAGVVNLVSAKPIDQFEAMASADFGNYTNRRFEGMINIPIVDDRLDLRMAGEWTKRDGYSFNEITGQPIDGRDLWSTRVSIGWNPSANFKSTLVWEHFQEDDDRLRSSKQLCHTDPGPSSILGVPIDGSGPSNGRADRMSQGCLPTSLYSPDAFQVPNGQSLSYFTALVFFHLANDVDPYSSTTQSRDLRVIESTINPTYRAKNDTVEYNLDYSVTPELTFTSQSGYNHDFLWSTEDFNRFNTTPGIFVPTAPAAPYPLPIRQPPAVLASRGQIPDDGMFCDPQLGCTNRLVAEDLSTEHAWQLSQEFRLSSSFKGPFNFSAGANYTHYETNEDYYVFINAVSLIATLVQLTPLPAWNSGVSDNHECLHGFFLPPHVTEPVGPLACGYIDPNPISNLNNNGHNYFLSQNPYTLNSYAGFGEVYYDIVSDLKLTGGVRWTEDEKHFVQIPSLLLVQGWGYPTIGVVDQKWGKATGRLAVNWTPKLDFTDQTLLYSSFAHGYKAGGANPPGAILLSYALGADGDTTAPVHPLTFKPEFVNAFELGSKNTLLDGALTLNGDVFFYDYKNYQISQIVDRTSINLNFDATVRGSEVEATWEPVPGLKFSFAGGYEDTAVAKGQKAIDLMDRTAGNPDWVVVKPAITQASNCIIPAYVIAAAPYFIFPFNFVQGDGADSRTALTSPCGVAYALHRDPQTNAPYTQDPPAPAPAGYPGFDPLSVDPNAPANVNNGLGLPPNNGEGFAKDLSNHELPNAPHYTASFTAEYTMPVSQDWAATLHSDFYWQSQSFARIFNDRPYDELRGYSNLNLALILTSANGWQVLGYLKNVFDTTAITGDFLNSDDTGLTTNVFLTDPRLFGVRVTKNF